MKMNLKPGHETELCHMVIGRNKDFFELLNWAIVNLAWFFLPQIAVHNNEHTRSFMDWWHNGSARYGVWRQTWFTITSMINHETFFEFLLQINRVYIEPFEKIFIDSYNTVHRLEIGKLRNVSKVFAHLLFTDAIK